MKMALNPQFKQSPPQVDLQHNLNTDEGEHLKSISQFNRGTFLSEAIVNIELEDSPIVKPKKVGKMCPANSPT
jgi:hypothetical protein